MAPAPTLDELIATVADRSAGEDPLVQLSSAVELAGELGTMSDALLNHFVETARSAGASWAQIGSALGVSKQGAQQRFVGRTIQVEELPHHERMTARARTSLAAAVKEARTLGHGYVGTEHLLLGLLHEPRGLAVKAIELSGSSITAVREALVPKLAAKQETSSMEPVLTPRARRALDLTLGEALRLGHNYIGTEHILLGLLKEGEGLGGQTLTQLGISHEIAGAAIVKLLSGYPT